METLTLKLSTFAPGPLAWSPGGKVPRECSLGPRQPTHDSDLPVMVAFDPYSPACRWSGAFYWWATHDGDLSLCIELLREGVQLSAADSRTLADVLSGRLMPRSKTGGPSAAKQRLIEWRDRQVCAYFDAALAIVHETYPTRPPRGGWRNAAADSLAGRLDFSPHLSGEPLTADQVLRIANAKRRRKFETFSELTKSKKPPG